MTCIVGLQFENCAFIGADSAGSDGWQTRTKATKKVFRSGDYVIGYTTSFRMGQILQHVAILPKCEEPTEEFMVKEFVESIRKTFKDVGYSKIENNEEIGGEFIVGVKGRIFQIGSNYQVDQNADGMHAVGSGFMFALGSLRTTKAILNPHHRIITALEAAAYFDNSVCDPFEVFEIKGE
jgi:ATP-dependent protease HslVU (ClpYQ) peptidase subunit